MVKLVIQRYTREAGVRNLERNLAALARAAAVRVAEQEQAVSVSKDVHKLASPLLDNRLAEGAEMEMEVIPMGVNNHEISNVFRIASLLVVDEAMLEKTLGVIISRINSFFYQDIHFCLWPSMTIYFWKYLELMFLIWIHLNVFGRCPPLFFLEYWGGDALVIMV